MLEVEAKVPIGAGEYEALFTKLKTMATYVGEQVSEDCYYEQLKKGTIRVRKRGGESTFDLKLCETIEGIESNLEMEWKLKDGSAWKKLLKNLGLQPYMKKAKKSHVFQMKGFRIELNHIRNLGHYLEIERLLADEADLKKAKKELIHCFHALGYSEKQFEPKRYLELLNNRR